MKRIELQKKLSAIAQAIGHITDAKIRAIQEDSLNLIELLADENEQLRTMNQSLRDENNRLKGEQGKPSIRKQRNPNHSSEKDRKPRGQQGKKKPKKSKKKRDKIKIDRTETCNIDPQQLPADAQFKGYQSVVVQDISIQTANVKFIKRVYYSPSKKKTYVAPLPLGYEGEFGPGLKTLILDLHQSHKMTESAIHAFVSNHGTFISLATISRMLIDDQGVFHREKSDIVHAGLASTIHQQMDDTGARVRGINHYTHILCNAFYTAYFTRRSKDRLTIIDILSQGKMTFEFSESSYSLMEQMQLPEKQLLRLRSFNPQKTMERAEVKVLLSHLFPAPKKHKKSRRIILDASAIIAYQQLPHAIELLLTDDAPQFKQITMLLALCWIHDGRHYKKLNPVVPSHRKSLDDFLKHYWDYYHQLLDYKKRPTPEYATRLDDKFEQLFSTKTGYEQLDERIQKTLLKKDSLLLVLKHPTLPLHNNNSELGARVQARYRDISFHTMCLQGTEAKDTFMTIVETAKKLGVNTYHYLYDRVSKRYEMPSLASLIEQKGTGAFCDTG